MKGLAFLFVLIVVLLAPQIYLDIQTNQTLQHKQQLVDQALEKANQLSSEAVKQDGGRPGDVKVRYASRLFTEQKLHEFLRDEPGQGIKYNYTWEWQGQKHATVSAPGLDRQHHFVNSYLVGFKPFDTEYVWVPLYTLAMRKRYEYDHIQYSGLQDLWQNSEQGFHYTRGDCEDHALVLADWLIGLGYDARVVVGDYKDEGHAWVVLIMEGKEYLLEATSKARLRSLNSYRLAYLETDYRPRYQFNRDDFWYNQGSSLTTSYRGTHWYKKSTFIPRL